VEEMMIVKKIHALLIRFQISAPTDLIAFQRLILLLIDASALNAPICKSKICNEGVNQTCDDSI
jgi:hypothetical protein